MAYMCANCEKTAVVGSSQKHKRGVAGKRWRKRVTPTPRLFRVNLQKYNGRTLCAKCIKRIKKDAHDRSLSA